MHSTDDFQIIMRSFLALDLSLIKILFRYDQLLLKYYESYYTHERWWRSVLYE